MVTDPLLALVARYEPLTPGEAAAVADAWGEVAPVAAGDVLLAPGAPCGSLWFQDAGYGRFYAEPDGADVTRHFVPPGTLFTVVASFYGGGPSREGLQALTAGRVRRLRREANDRLVARVPAWDRFRRAYLREVYDYLDRTTDALRSTTARQRYEAFLEDQPGVALHVPLRHVASYLGMTPQSLSRVRARVARGRFLPDAKARGRGGAAG